MPDALICLLAEAELAPAIVLRFRFPTKRFPLMPGVVVREDESFEDALRRFKKQIQKSGILGEAKKRRAYDKPSVKKKKKSLLARKRLLRKLRKMQRSRQR